MDFFNLDFSGGAIANAATDAASNAGTFSGASPYASGWLQQLASLGTGYLSKRLDVDIQQRIAGSMPYPQQWGVGAEIYYSQAGVRPGQMPQRVGVDLNGMLPWLLIGAAVFFVVRK